MINITDFISQYITHRSTSFFREDIEQNYKQLSDSIKNKSMLVIGGAGTIGSSFIKATLQFHPGKLVVVDISENGLTELTRNLRSTFNQFVPDEYRTYPINFNDQVFFNLLEAEGHFDIIANFAAHKHVRSEKDHFSITALLENNIIRAEKFLRYLLKTPPDHFFCVSTDKAANPVNIMGASKKIMEEMIMAYAANYPVTTARFANVAFSNGSLLDGFIYRMMNQHPFSVPVDVKRYFVSPAESGEICMLACMLGNSGDIFFPKLKSDQLTSFKEITEAFIESQGMKVIPFGTEAEAKTFAAQMDYRTNRWPVYYFTSDTSGEKAFEEFFTEQEILDMERFISLGVITNAPQRPIPDIHHMIDQLVELLKHPSLTKSEIVSLLSEFIPTFHHIETGKSLDQKM